MRHLKSKAIPTAGANHVFMKRRPDVCPHEELAVWRRKHDNLRAIGIVQRFFPVPLRQLLDENVAQKFAIVSEPPQPSRRIVQTFIIGRIEPECCYGIRAFFK
ncbi:MULTISPECIES: hypothetical protein [unclassified Novosphingobium]|uniref:hypothetical protein n=1 Tax=unclassified Novosphingobium TaxID=2644732 RepID=UPI0025F26452|nr:MULTISPECIES: hypothetical protein [unclassified Novosphingobium]HQV03881.1 hypothetical protein [Novosphingobium sp.]